MTSRPKLFGGLLIAAALWTGFIWIFRTIAITGGDHSASFVAVHGGLALLSVALAIPVGYVGMRLVRAQA